MVRQIVRGERADWSAPLIFWRTHYTFLYLTRKNMNGNKKKKKKRVNKQSAMSQEQLLVSDDESRGHREETSVIQVQPKCAGNTSVQRCRRKKVMWDTPLVHYWRVWTSSSGSEKMKIRWPRDHHDYTTRKRILCQNVITDQGLSFSVFTDVLKLD